MEFKILLISLLIWFFLGSLITQFLWIVKDLKERLINDKGKYSEDYYLRIYTKGILFGLILGPFSIVFLAFKMKDVLKELVELEIQNENKKPR